MDISNAINNMLDLYVTNNSFYILTSEKEVLQTDKKGNIKNCYSLEKYTRYIELNFSGEIINQEILPDSISVENGQLKVTYEDDVSINLIQGKKVNKTEKKNSSFKINKKNNSFNIGDTEINSKFTPVEISTEEVSEQDTAVFTCEIGSSVNGEVTSNRIYFMSDNVVSDYVQLKDQLVIVPHNGYKFGKPHSVYQMIINDNRISIVKLKHQKNTNNIPKNMINAKPIKLDNGISSNKTSSTSTDAKVPLTTKSVHQLF